MLTAWICLAAVGMISAVPLDEFNAQSENVMFDNTLDMNVLAKISESLDKANVQQSTGNPWPMPQKFTSSGIQRAVSVGRFQFLSDAKNPCQLIYSAFERYYKIIFQSPGVKSFSSSSGYSRNLRKYQEINILSVKIKQMCTEKEFPSLKMDEMYSLKISNSSTAFIKANTVWGALRGLETFSQLIYRHSDGMFVVNETYIVDFPRFSHRGILLDTSRHFLDKHFLLANLDAMAYNKMNVFHWHIVDDQSFPYESRSFPQLSESAAFGQGGHVYSQADVAEIIEYARLRGIRVLPEFDTPGHTQSWFAIPGLLTDCYSKGKPDGSYGPIDPSRSSNYAFLHKLMSEIAQVFADHYIHLGGDEVNFSCWKSNPRIKLFMEQHGFNGSFSRLEQFYEQRLLDIVGTLGKGYVVWQEVIDNGCKVRNDTVVHVWKGGYQQELARVTSLGYEALLSSPWYLDYISYSADWRRYYAVEPLDFNVSDPKQVDLVMGGEACLWGELVDGTNVLSRLWPRASAVAERLWSAKSVRDLREASPRIEEHRCRMIRRGIAAEPLGPGFCLYEQPCSAPLY